MCQQETADWIAHIVAKTVENYAGRKVVIWGKYAVSDTIKAELIKQEIETAFFVDSDPAKTDDEQVFSPDCLSGKKDSYYIVIPLAFYQEIREKLRGGVTRKIGITIIFVTAPCVKRQHIMRMPMEIKS